MRHLSLFVVVSCLSAYLAVPMASSAGMSDAARDSAARSITYLERAMDEFHTRFAVYDDISSAGNHFHARAKIPDAAAPVTINGSDTSNPHSGATAIRNELTTTGGPFGGFLFLNGVLRTGDRAPRLNFGTEPDAGFDLSHATRLRFWARGQHGGERVQFFVGGTGWDPTKDVKMFPYADSTPRRPADRTPYVLTTEWKRIEIDLSGVDFGYVLNGFGWVASLADNPTGAVFFLDDIEYELDDTGREARLSEPRFARSFTTAPFQTLPPPAGDFDLVLRNVAFTYDNALALLAFLAIDTAEGLERARLIGDAFVYAAVHDRTYVDGRVRDAYAAGDLALPPGWAPEGKKGTVPVSGFYDEAKQEFIEVEQLGVSTGNNAWVMLALLSLYRRIPDPRYLATAEKLGQFIASFEASEGGFQGFHGGIDRPEADAALRPWASTEHNLDAVAAFSLLEMVQGRAIPGTGADAHAHAKHAQLFVEAMFEEERGCYLAGTINPEERNALAGQLPVDTQAWTILALPESPPRHQRTLACARSRHQTTDEGFVGFDFNDDRDGVWFEGTAHVATALNFTTDAGELVDLQATLRRAQDTTPFGDGFGIVAAAHDVVSTGFLTPAGDPFNLFRRLHLGATSWNVFAQLGFNPFYGSFRCDADGSGHVGVTDGVSTLRAAAGLEGACALRICDVDRNGTVTVTDGVQVLRRAAELSSSCSFQ